MEGTARAAGTARVEGTAWVEGTACVEGTAWAEGTAWVEGTALVEAQLVQGTVGRGGAGKVEGTARLSSAKAGDVAKTKVTLHVRRLRLHDRAPQAGGFRSGSSFLPAVEAGCQGRGAGQRRVWWELCCACGWPPSCCVDTGEGEVLSSCLCLSSSRDASPLGAPPPTPSHLTASRRPTRTGDWGSGKECGDSSVGPSHSALLS